jgi:tetratricopeptide (TPR) repeat protein
MKKENILILALCSVVTVFFSSCSLQSSDASQKTVTEKEESVQTLADEKINQARILVEKYPNLSKSHLQLAASYLQKVRETGDYSINKIAADSIDKALEIEPQSFDARLLQAQIYLSEHEFAKALELALEMDKMRPQNPLAYAVKTDALTELGRYDEAVEAAQQFVDIRPNATSYTRVAHLRSLHGDIEGAIEARNLAIRMADPLDTENYAWYYSELGKEYFNKGDFEKAKLAFDKALKILPEYHWALAGKGMVLAADGKFEKAAEIYEKLQSRVPETSRDIFLGDIYQKMGREAEAEKIYQTVANREKKKENGDLHRVALLWADHDTNLDEALKVAKEDREVNNDLLASDTYAWALYKNGNYAEAKKQMKDALRLDSKNALFYYHLGMIENKLGNKKEAVKNLELALATNPSFDLIQADIARETLRNIKS